MGIGKPADRTPVEDYVLQRFDSRETDLLQQIVFYPGRQIGKNYPLPIVDHQQARPWVLAAYRQSGN